MTNRFSVGSFSSRTHPTCGVLASSIVAAVLALSACNEQQPSVVIASDKAGGLSTSLTPPDMLIQSRAINTNALRLRIVVNGETYPGVFEPGTLSGTVNFSVARGQQVEIAIIWSELYEGEILDLAVATDRFTVQPVNGGTTFEHTVNAAYTTNVDLDGNRIGNARLDFDEDQISNFDELTEGSDPTVAGVMTAPADPAVQVPIELRANIPERLRDVNSNIDVDLSAVAVIDRTRVPLTREGNTWVGQITRPANTGLPITYSFYLTTRPDATLAEWQDTLNSGAEGITAESSSNDYNYNFDNDDDETNNLDETILGSNPDDANDPRLNPCDISAFEPGCNIDTDGDGDPDSVETEIADEDGDSIPNYQESRGDDADDDGFSAEQDRDESDPCVPDDQAIACNNPGQPPVELPAASLLSFNFYEGLFENMPDFNRLTPASSGMIETFSLSAIDGPSSYALQFSGKLFIEEAGEYTFYSESDDGSLIFVDGNLVVDNDGIHNLTETSGMIALAEGLHDIVVEYFQNGDSEGLTVSWESSTINKQPIPETVLFAP